MPRGRHRHEQPLHRLLPPAAVAAAALACAGGAWFVGAAGFADTDTVILRGLAAAAAVAAVTGAVLTRNWDRKAGRRVGELQARRAGAEWRAEERQAELEAELEESRELRGALQKKLTAKRAELSRLRNEHAALLRRYANAETERASALEGRRLLELEAAAPTRALTSGATDHRSASGAPSGLTYLQASEALRHLRRSAERQRRLRALELGDEDGTDGGTGTAAAQEPARAPRPYPATASSVAPPRATPARRLGGGFDFFGSGGDPGSGARSGARSAPDGAGPGARRPGSPGADDHDPEPDPARPRPAAHRPAGKVVDLGADADADADPDAPAALDIAELRGAIS